MDSKLFVAAASGDEEALGRFSEILMKRETKSQKNSVLHVAVLHNQKRIVEKILERLSDHHSLLYRKNSDGDTALHIAARLGLEDIVRVLIESAKGDFCLKRLTRKVNRESDSALHDSARNGHLGVVRLLIQEDRKLALLTNSAGESPLFLALERNYFDITRELLDSTEKCSLAGRRGMNALHLAVIYLHEGKNGAGHSSSAASLHNQDQELQGLVSDMIRKYSSALVEQDNLGWTCLHYAARYGVEEVVGLFLENDKSCSYIRDNEGMSAFHIATKQGEVQIIRQIMTFCPDISELLTCNGQNALHVAVTTRKENAVEYLLTTLGSNGLLNKQDEDGNTPFHLAAIIEDYEILELIIYMVRYMVLNNEKVNQNVMNKDGLTVMDIIQSCNTLEDSRKEGIISELRGVDCVPGLRRQLIERNTQLQNVEKIKGVPQPQLENKLVEESKSTNLLTKLFFQPFINPRLTKRAAEVDIVLATLIATITFAAAFQIPGGYESGGDTTSVGLPILRDKYLFKVFIIFDSLAFGLSSSSIFLHFLASMSTKGENSVFLQIAKLTTFYSILAMVGTFFSTLQLVSEHSKGIYIASYVCLAAFLIGPFYLKYFDFLSWIKGCLPYASVCVLLLFFVVGVIGLVGLFFFKIIVHFHRFS